MTSVDCTWHYYNRSAAMGWVFGESSRVSVYSSTQQHPYVLTSSVWVYSVGFFDLPFNRS